MSARKDKKMRQEYRREVRARAEADARLIGNNLKPKPKWVPWPVWMWALGFFIKIK